MTAFCDSTVTLEELITRWTNERYVIVYKHNILTQCWLSLRVYWMHCYLHRPHITVNGENKGLKVVSCHRPRTSLKPSLLTNNGRPQEIHLHQLLFRYYYIVFHSTRTLLTINYDELKLQMRSHMTHIIQERWCNPIINIYLYITIKCIISAISRN